MVQKQVLAAPGFDPNCIWIYGIYMGYCFALVIKAGN